MIQKKNTSTCKFRIGGNIRKWRNIKDIKQKELANALKLSEAAVSNIENDVTNITVTQLEDIAQALHVTIEQLLSDPQEKISAPPPAEPATAFQQYRQHVDTALLNAIIASMEKRDQQLQTIMQQFIHTISMIMQQDNFRFTASKPVASRA